MLRICLPFIHLQSKKWRLTITAILLVVIATLPPIAQARLFGLLPDLPSFKDQSNEYLYSLFEQVETSKFFIRPNERSLSRMKWITAAAEPGVLLAIGTERGFFSAAINNQFTELLLIDMDPRAVLFNRLNIALLRLAHDRADYLHLRFEANFSEISSRARMSDLTITETEFYWWCSQARSRDAFADLRFWQGRENNYMQSDKAFERLSVMAKNNLIGSYLIDISKPQSVKTFLKEVVGDKTISMADLSNTWWSNFASLAGIRKFASTISANLNENSILLFTHYADPRLTSEWTYFGVSWRFLRDNWRRFKTTLSRAADNPQSVPLDQNIAESIDLGFLSHQPLLCEQMFR